MVLFLAHGHSGTRAVAKLLEYSGVYIGTPENMNATYDSIPWSYDFQRYLVPKLFKYGKGCEVSNEVFKVAEKCKKKHLTRYNGGKWGFKVCNGMFAYPLYNAVFPKAKYIYMVRDGRDAILSTEGYFYMTNPNSRKQHWDFFNIITFGISNDKNKAPFSIPKKPSSNNDSVMKNRYWIQAKCWSEHVRMMQSLSLSNVFKLLYEDMCTHPVLTMKEMFDYLELDFTDRIEEHIKKFFYKSSLGKWKKFNYTGENMGKIFHSMAPELQYEGYKV